MAQKCSTILKMRGKRVTLTDFFVCVSKISHIHVAIFEAVRREERRERSRQLTFMLLIAIALAFLCLCEPEPALRQRQLTHALARRRENRVADGRQHRRQRWLAEACWRDRKSTRLNSS